MSETQTEDSGQALADAWKGAFAQARAGSPMTAEPGVIPVPSPVVAEEAPVVAPAVVATGASETEPAQPDESPELAQLRADLATAKAEAESIRAKGAESISWARQGFLRKSTEADRARAILAKAAQTGELDKAELEAFLAAGSPGYQPGAVYGPGQTMAQVQPQPDERMALDVSQFVHDYGLNDQQSEAFTSWLNGEGRQHLRDRDFVPGDHYSTLRHSYERYRTVTARPDPVMVQAAATVARTQKELARSASAPPSRVMPTPEPTRPDPMKMSIEERESSGLIDAAFRELAQQLRQ